MIYNTLHFFRWHWSVGSHTGLAGAQDYPSTYIRFYEGRENTKIPAKIWGDSPKLAVIWFLMFGTKMGQYEYSKDFFPDVRRLQSGWGKWNGDGKTEIGVFRLSAHQFYLDYNGNGVWEGAATNRSLNFGLTGDKPLSGKWI